MQTAPFKRKGIERRKRGMFTRMMVQGILIVIYTLEFAGLLVAALSKYKKKYYVPVKMMCSVSFVVIAAIFAYVSGHTRYFFMMLVPLLFCAAGDLYMGFYQIASKKQHMLIGMILFLLAHMGFLISFFRIDATVTWWNIFLPIVAVIVFFTVKKLSHLHMGRLTIPASIYCVFLSLMLSKSTQYMVLYPGLASGWLGLGGMLFFTSDFTIIFLYFYKFHKPESRRRIHCINLATYYFGILAFDISILYFAGM